MRPLRKRPPIMRPALHGRPPPDRAGTSCICRQPTGWRMFEEALFIEACADAEELEVVDGDDLLIDIEWKQRKIGRT